MVLRIFGTTLLFAMHFMLAKYMSVSDYGLFSYVISLSMIVATFATLGWPAMVMRYTAEYKSSLQWQHMKGLMIESIGIITVASAMVSVMSYMMSMINDTFMLVAALSPFLMVSLFRKRIFIGLGHTVGVLLPEEIIVPAALIIVTVYYSSAGLEVLSAYLILYFIASMASIIWVMVKLPLLGKAGKPEYNSRIWWRVAIPLAFVTGAQLLINQTGVFVLGARGDYEQAAIYSLSFRISLMVVFVMTAVHIVGASRLADAFHNRDKAKFDAVFATTLKWCFAGGIVPFVLFIVFSDYILLLFGKQYVDGTDILMVLCGAQMINAATGLSGSVLTMIGMEKLFSILLVITAFSQLPAAYLAADYWGAIGVAWVTAMAVSVISIVPMYVVYKKIKWS